MYRLRQRCYSTRISKTLDELVKKPNKRLFQKLLKNRKSKESVLSDVTKGVLSNNEEVIQFLNKVDVLKDRNLNQYVLYLIDHNQVNLAVSIIQNTHVAYSTIQTLIFVIENSLRKDFLINSYSLLQLIHSYGILNFQTEDLVKSVLYLTSSYDGAYFANYLFKEMSQSDVIQKLSRKDYTKVINSLLACNNENCNWIKSYDLLSNINTDRLKCNDEFITNLIIFLRMCPDTKRVEEILNGFDRTEDHLTLFKLEFFALNERERFTDMVKTLPKLDRPVMSTLLVSFSNLQDNYNFDKVVKSIRETYGPFTPLEFATITEHNLKKNKVEQALKLIENSDFELSKNSLVSLFKYFPNAEVQKTICLQLLKLNQDDPILEHFTTELIKYLSKIDNQEAVKFFVHFCKQNAKIENYKPFNYEKVGLSKEVKKIVKFNHRNMIQSIFIMLQQAIVEENFSIVSWCVEDLRSLGWDLESIIKLLDFYNPRYLQSILKPKLIDHYL